MRKDVKRIQCSQLLMTLHVRQYTVGHETSSEKIIASFPGLARLSCSKRLCRRARKAGPENE